MTQITVISVKNHNNLLTQINFRTQEILDISKNPLYERAGFMIRTLVESAFRTGCLSVASEGLIRQVLEMKGYEASDLKALTVLYEAVNSGQIEREARNTGAIAQLMHSGR